MTTQQGGFEYSCDYCRIPFKRDLHIQCAQCKEIRLCLTCFSYGKQLPPHKNSHSYYVIEYITKSIYDINTNNITWSGHEDILLLDGIEKYGLGNWKKIAQHIGNNKTSKQTELHYLQIYCNHDDDYFSFDQFIDIPSEEEEEDSDVIEFENKNKNNNKNKYKNKHKNRHKSTKKNDKLRTSFDFNEAQSSLAYLANVQKLSQSVNYYPYRHEFDAEYQDSAELLISDLASSDLMDDSNNKQIALNNLKHYDIILKMRNYIKNFILDRKLMVFHTSKFGKVTGRRQQRNGQQNLSYLKKQLIEKLQPFIKYFKTTQKYLDFIDSCVHIDASWKNIDTYLNHRKAGCRTLFDVNKRLDLIQQQSSYSSRRSHRSSNRSSRRNNRYNNNYNDHHEKHNNNKRKKSKRALLQIDDSEDSDNNSYNDLSFSMMNDLTQSEDDDDNDSDYDIGTNNNHNKNKKRKRSKKKGNNKNGSNEPLQKKRKLLNGLNNKFIQQIKDDDMMRKDEFDGYYGTLTTSTTNNGINKDESLHPSYLLLSPSERDFCCYLKILPTQYMQYKNVILMENMRNGKLDKKQLQKYFPNHNNRINDFCDFYSRMGWIELK